MARRVFLHIGLPKTGTTFLQTTMWENRPGLANQGFLYPGRNRMEHYRASQEVRGASDKAMGKHAGTWARLVRDLAAWDGNGLVSHEFFSMATPTQARAAVEALAPAEVQVVVTVRSYVLQFPAVWQEALKMNSSLGFDDFMEEAFAGRLKGAWGWASQDIPAVLDRWSAAVPPERLTVVTVPPPERRAGCSGSGGARPSASTTGSSTSTSAMPTSRSEPPRRRCYCESSRCCRARSPRAMCATAGCVNTSATRCWCPSAATGSRPAPSTRRGSRSAAPTRWRPSAPAAMPLSVTSTIWCRRSCATAAPIPTT